MTAINVTQGLFAHQGLRAGDCLAACNFLEYIREQNNNPTLQLYIPNSSLHHTEHCVIMRDFLVENTNYVTTTPENLVDLQVIPGTDPTFHNMYNLFGIRKDSLYQRQNIFFIEDKISIHNTKEIKKKIVIAPLIDADYNYSRNWDINLIQNMLSSFKTFDYEKIIAIKKPLNIDVGDWKYCHDYKEILTHIQECECYVGGDTGFSHLAGSLDDNKLRCYYYPKDTWGTTNPMNWKHNGKMIYY